MLIDASTVRLAMTLDREQIAAALTANNYTHVCNIRGCYFEGFDPSGEFVYVVAYQSPDMEESALGTARLCFVRQPLSTKYVLKASFTG